MKRKKEIRPYKEIMADVKTAKPGKECRKLNKELRAYKDRLPLFMRYPNIDVIIWVVAIIILLIK